MQNRSAIYVNFSQYDNTGRVLDYLRQQFRTVLHFSFDHLRLKNGRKINLLTIYRNGKWVTVRKLYSFRVSSFFMFYSLPIVAILMIIQTIYHSSQLTKKLDPPIFFTVNAYPALIGIILKKLGIVTRVFYWVWDYYPLKYPDWRMKMIRYMYLAFDTVAIRFADSLIFPNRRQLALRNKITRIRNHYKIIPLGGSKPIRFHTRVSNIIGFMGMLKDSQGVELLLKNLTIILNANPHMTIEIIGSGPEEYLYKNLAKDFGDRVNFYGFIEDQNRIDKIIRRWFVGLAVYRPVPSNESYYGDPSKIKVYLSQGVPIITTNVTDYGALAKKYSFGITIAYSGKQLLAAIRTIYKNQKMYRKQALSYAETFYYKRLYKNLLT